MLSSNQYLYSILRAWIAFATTALGTQRNTNDTSTFTTPVRLADIQQCPVAPKPICGDENCQGATFYCATQFLCSSENCFPGPDGRSIILAGCRCCPLPIHVECTDHRCAAPEGTRVCVSEPLRGCTCQTAKDRMETMKARAVDFGWTSDDLFEVDFEPCSSEENEEGPVRGSSNSVPIATIAMDHLAWLQGYWAMDVGGKLR
ncbi:hypothetical protein F4808DRAFT_445223 [Astrocystis sublimbata]|nr:hypothetical protein F4808DRAFT_445222 [Astrocystis sublimbata]KAI0189889.1 hypothetical protein F4808DRAFT_445223 [Astrocystis sublimbata]